MPSADFCAAIRRPHGLLSPPSDTTQISRGKSHHLHRTPAGSTAWTLDGYGLRDLLLTRPVQTASYPIPVRRVAALLHAAFRPHLAVTPWRFASTSPPSGCAGDSHPQVMKHARHTKKGRLSPALEVSMRLRALAPEGSLHHSSRTTVNGPSSTVSRNMAGPEMASGGAGCVVSAPSMT